LIAQIFCLMKILPFLVIFLLVAVHNGTIGLIGLIDWRDLMVAFPNSPLLMYRWTRRKNRKQRFEDTIGFWHLTCFHLFHFIIAC
jgi:hypothetical protein